MRHKRVVMIGAVIAVLITAYLQYRNHRLPTTVSGALAAAKARGFSICGNHVSKTPLTADEVNNVCINAPLEDWQGLVRVVDTKYEEQAWCPEHLLMRKWGKVTVYGDPEFVRLLVTP